MPIFPRISAAVLLASNCSFAVSQSSTTIKSLKLPPASFVAEPMIVLDSVVTEQWPATLQLVNVPTNMKLLNPGQCIRVVALASGEGHEHLFEHASMAWSVKIDGKETTFSYAAVTAAKQLKPEGTDFLMSALQAGGIKNKPMVSFVSAAASDSRWCVPLGSPDEKVEIRATVKLSEQQTTPISRTIQIESLATAAGKGFKDMKELSEFSQTYHLSPEPGRLLPAFQFLVSANQDSLIPFAFFRSAFIHDAPTVSGFGPGLATSPKLTQVLALNLLSKAGVHLLEPPPMTEEDKRAIAESPDLPDAYDMKPTEELFTKLDFLWADFSATGRLQPVTAVVSALAWRDDFEVFDRIRKSGKNPDGLTDSLVRGITYTAAGWSLKSFQETDPLAADYIEAISANPATSGKIKAELTQLGTNPAFKHIDN